MRMSSQYQVLGLGDKKAEELESGVASRLRVKRYLLRLLRADKNRLLKPYYRRKLSAKG
ncbi:unnamed protein product [marine sediment metagenome]|uniref:Uncharacterized protein n=1 Tax=marine sediment metagenome TaxID=412755 RepID=X1SCB4_9ZZZZ